MLFDVLDAVKNPTGVRARVRHARIPGMHRNRYRGMRDETFEQGMEELKLGADYSKRTYVSNFVAVGPDQASAVPGSGSLVLFGECETMVTSVDVGVRKRKDKAVYASRLSSAASLGWLSTLGETFDQ